MERTIYLRLKSKNLVNADLSMYFICRFVIFYIKAYSYCLQVLYLIVAFRKFYVRTGI